MSTKAMSFSGVTPSPCPRRRSWRQRLLRRPSFPQCHPIAGFGPLTQPIRLSLCIFSHGEVDGAEGIDGAEI
jgi:hypothetical protein